ncbi:alpha/beta hydrolase [Accumulibacter sp.]|uniref:alpha/beta hydrolase n=2 Tax=Accumulibacter sp. TaxID=2053492 RepID=UPI0025D03522|nr:alpha/beta hydrolase [Accumulibacter sp.]MCM8594269.1 alpha/beta hydrolase [Accumulibacter sp.]MDS4048413.1 alpha/beta hydrolase [Accumulibacter sp.]
MTAMLSRIAISMLAACLLAFAGLTMFQNHLLYFPDRAPVAEMTGGGLTPWPSAGDFRGLLAEPAGPARATVIVFHGNAGHAAHRQYYSDVLNGLALRVILAEYPGYGPRGGELGESSLVADAERTIADARRAFSGPLLIIGESLGAGVAAAASARQAAAVSGMLLFTPWDRLENVARHHYPLLPVKWLLRDQYDSTAHLAGFGRPILVAVAEDDAIVPARFGQALFAALSEPRRLVVIRGAGHNDWFDRLDQRWWSEAIEFLLSAGL